MSNITQSKWVYWISDGGGFMSPYTSVFQDLMTWIRTNSNRPDLIVYGGDVYMCGTDCDFDAFLQQVGGAETLQLMCETAGNHDWKSAQQCKGCPPGYPAQGYENFWSSYPSLQPIDKNRVGGARYEHYIDMNGWRLIFLDTGQTDECAWPVCDRSRVEWLDQSLNRGPQIPGQPPCRTNMIFTHFSRLSRGMVGDNPGVEEIWQQLFDSNGDPRAVCTLGGHDHNVSVYAPRDQNLAPTSPEKGVQIMVNGGGGAGLFAYQYGTVPELYPPLPPPPCAAVPGFCVTQIELVSPNEARVIMWNFGASPKIQVHPNNVYEVVYTVP